jgi:hypothetical protein
MRQFAFLPALVGWFLAMLKRPFGAKSTLLLNYADCCNSRIYTISGRGKRLPGKIGARKILSLLIKNRIT